MTLNQLASRIAKAEGKKHQASVGDIREILGILADILYEDYESGQNNNIEEGLTDAGEKRAAKKAKAKKRK